MRPEGRNAVRRKLFKERDKMVKGSLVRIKAEWRNIENEGIYEVMESNGDRLFISPIVWRGDIRCQELVRDYMVDTMILERA